jgi:hypothetical protein
MRKHEAVLAYWLSIRGNRELPPLRDLDPLEISDAAPHSVLLELIGGGEDAEIRHVGEKLKGEAEVERVSEAPRPSILSSIARKLSIVAISRNYLAFEDEFSADGTTTRCWVTLLPLSAAGAWVDYVYAYVSFDTAAGEGTKKKLTEAAAEVEVPAEERVAEAEETPAAADEEVLELDSVEEAELEPQLEGAEEQPVEVALEDPVEAEVMDEMIPAAEPASEIVEEQPVEAALEESVEPEAIEEPTAEPEPAPAPRKKPGFSFDSLAAAAGFYGTKSVKVEPVMPKAAPKASLDDIPVEPEEDIASIAEDAAAPVQEALPAEEEMEPLILDEPVAAPVDTPVIAAEDKPHNPSEASEGTLQSKLTEVRSKADEARMAKLKANAALYEGLSAAYDFALDAEDSPEEYLRIVEGAGLKIQLRSPMRPVVKLAFDGMCDDSTITQLEAVLAWAIEQDLPRGTLGQRIEEAGGIGPILNGMAKAA